MKELQKFLLRPRYLQAIPSLVVLTTVMAWGALPDVEEGGEADKHPGMTLSQRAGGSGMQAADVSRFMLRRERPQD